MTSVQESDGLSALRQRIDGSRSTAGSTLPRASSASARGGGDKSVGMWFFSRTQQQLERPNDDDVLGFSYGAAAQALAQRPRPGPMTYGKVVGFELDAPAAMHAMIATAQKQSHRQLLPRGPRTHNSVCRAFPRAAAVRHRDKVAAVPSRDSVARLESQLNTCCTLQRQLSPETKSSTQRQRSNSVTTAALSCRRRPESCNSGRRRQPLRSTSCALRVATLTKEWVKAEEERAVTDGSTGVHVEKVLLPIPAHWTLPSNSGQLSEKSCVSRFRDGKFRPLAASSMTTRSRAASAGEETAQEAAQPPWRQRLLAEPIQSYWALKDAVSTPVKPTPSSQIPFLGSARMRSQNCERRRHSFEYQRFQLQGELEDKLEWRDRCRSIFLRRSSAQACVANVSANSLSNVPSMPQAAGVNAVGESLLTDVFSGSDASAVPWQQRVSASQLSSSLLPSVWCQAAARQAMQQEKHRLVALLQSFVVTCGAAALTLTDTEELRAETVRRVWQPEEDAGCSHTAFFYREQFLKFLRRRYQLHTSRLHGAADTMRPTDIIDALPSQAEASFARYAYKILPNHSV